MVKDKNGEPIKWEPMHILTFLLSWGIAYLMVTSVNFWVFLLYGIDLRVMWVINLPSSILLAWQFFFNLLKSSGDDTSSWGR
jgi:hypothetical protein